MSKYPYFIYSIHDTKEDFNQLIMINPGTKSKREIMKLPSLIKGFLPCDNHLALFYSSATNVIKSELNPQDLQELFKNYDTHHSFSISPDLPYSYDYQLKGFYPLDFSCSQDSTSLTAHSSHNNICIYATYTTHDGHYAIHEIDLEHETYSLIDTGIGKVNTLFFDQDMMVYTGTFPESEKANPIFVRNRITDNLTIIEKPYPSSYLYLDDSYCLSVSNHTTASGGIISYIENINKSSLEIQVLHRLQGTIDAITVLQNTLYYTFTTNPPTTQHKFALYDLLTKQTKIISGEKEKVTQLVSNNEYILYCKKIAKPESPYALVGYSHSRSTLFPLLQLQTSPSTIANISFTVGSQLKDENAVVLAPEKQHLQQSASLQLFNKTLLPQEYEFVNELTQFNKFSHHALIKHQGNNNEYVVEFSLTHDSLDSNSITNYTNFAFLSKNNYLNHITTYDIGDKLSYAITATQDSKPITMLHKQGAFDSIKQRHITQLISQFCEGLSTLHEENIPHGYLHLNAFHIVDYQYAQINYPLAIFNQKKEVSRYQNNFIAPELLDNSEYIPTVQGDVYTLGLLLYTMVAKVSYNALSQKNNFQDFLKSYDTIKQTITAKRESTFPELIHVCSKAIHPSPDARYSNATEMLKDIQYFQQSLLKQTQG